MPKYHINGCALPVTVQLHFQMLCMVCQVGVARVPCRHGQCLHLVHICLALIVSILTARISLMFIPYKSGCYGHFHIHHAHAV